MSLFDKLKQAIADTQREVAKEASKRAAKGALNKVGDAISGVADDFLTDAEAALERKQEAAEGRPDVRPDSAKADEIEDYVKQAASRAEQLKQERVDREQSARDELARLKAELKKEADADE